MKLENWKKSLKNDISHNKIDSIFKELKTKIQNDKLNNQLILLESSYKEKKEMIRLGTIKLDEWTTFNNKIVYSILELISELTSHDLSEKSELKVNKNISIDDALYWLSNFLISYSITDTPSNKNDESIESTTYSVSECILEKNGNYIIETSCIGKGGPHNLINLIMNFKYTGNFSNVSEVIIYPEKRLDNDSGINEKYIVKGYSFGRSDTITCQGTTRLPGDKEIDETEHNTNHFFIYAPDIESANRIKNAIDFISIYFERKEDVF